MEDRWIKWEPLADIQHLYSTEIIIERKHYFSLILTTYKRKKIIAVHFNHGVVAFRETNESYRLKSIGDLSSRYTGSPERWSFFKVEESTYLLLSAPAPNCIHFAFTGEDSWVDVLAHYEPTTHYLYSWEECLAYIQAKTAE